jgi:hypothetical protein
VTVSRLSSRLLLKLSLALSSYLHLLNKRFDCGYFTNTVSTGRVARLSDPLTLASRPRHTGAFRASMDVTDEAIGLALSTSS